MQHLLRSDDDSAYFPISPFVLDAATLRRLPLRIKRALTHCLIFGTHIENVSISTCRPQM